MTDLFKLLEKIEAKPALYIGSASVHDLRLFILGYRFAKAELKVAPLPEESDFHKNFQPWLQSKLNLLTAQAWDKMILLNSQTEEAAFSNFFSLLKEFLQRDRQQDRDPVLLDNDQPQLSRT
jgi:hypothetical protein